MTGSRRILGRVGAAISLAAGAVVALAVPASATTTITVTSPKDQAVVTNTSTPPLLGTVDSDSYICGLDLAVAPTGGQKGVSSQTTTLNLVPSGGRTASKSTQFSWAPTLPANGPYTLTVTAHMLPDPFCQLGQAETASGTRSFALEVKAAAPSGLTATPTADRHVDLAWKANSEPDINGYAVFRVAKSGKTCAAPTEADRIASVDAAAKPAFTDTFGSADPGGTYCYFVEASRPGANAESVVLSAPSQPSEAAVAAAPAAGAGGVPGATSSGADGTTGGSVGSGGGASGGSGASGGAGAPNGGGLDLSRLGALQDQARARAGKSPRAGLAPLPDGTFDPKLPFKPRQGDDAEAALPGQTVTRVHDGDNSGAVRTAGAIAASLVVFVVLGHLLLLRREVRRVPVLDAVEP